MGDECRHERFEVVETKAGATSLLLQEPPMTMVERLCLDCGVQLPT